MTIRDLELSLKDEFSGKQDKPGKFRAVITDAAGNRIGTNTIWRNEPRREVWFQSWGSGSLGSALCDNIEPLIGLGVIVQFDDFIGRYEVLRDDPTQRDGNANRRSYRITGDADLQSGGRFQHWLEAERFQPLSAYPGTGLSVSVVSGYYEINGTWTKYDGIVNFSIAAHQPAGPSEHALIGLYLDNANTLNAVAGATVATSTTAADPTWPANSIPLAVIDLDDSQTALTLADDIDNRRAFVTTNTNTGGSGGTSVVNLMYNSLTHDLYQKAHIITAIADDTYFADGWNVIHNQPATDPDVGRQIGGSTDPFSHYMRIQSAAANTQFGAVHFFYSADTKIYRDQPVSLSIDAWGSNISNVRAAIIEWSGTADTLTSDVVGTWSTGNPTLATNWTYASTPSSSTSIGATRTQRYTFDNITITNTTNNMAVFIWTPDSEASGDWLNLSRVQLEPGTISTDFVPRTYPTALQIAQTLVNKSYSQGVVPGTASVIGVTERQTRTAVPATTAGNLRFPIQWPVTMRKTPAVTLYDYTAGTANAVSNATGGNVRTGCIAELATNNDSSMAAINVDNTSANAIALDDLIVFHYYAEALL